MEDEFIRGIVIGFLLYHAFLISCVIYALYCLILQDMEIRQLNKQEKQRKQDDPTHPRWPNRFKPIMAYQPKLNSVASVLFLINVLIRPLNSATPFTHARKLFSSTMKVYAVRAERPSRKVILIGTSGNRNYYRFVTSTETAMVTTIMTVLFRVPAEKIPFTSLGY